MQANPFIHNVNQQHASLVQDGETVIRGLIGQTPEQQHLGMVEPDGIEPTT